VSQAMAIALPDAGRREIFLGVAAILAIYGPMFPALVQEWATYPNLSHGFAIPVIAAYLVWTRRDSLAGVPVTPTWRALPLVAAGLVLYGLASLGSEPFFARLSFPLTLAGSVMMLAGPAVARQVVPGIAYLIFMMPLPYLTLKGITRSATLFDATVTASVLPWLGVPVFRRGTLLYLANITLEVADACSSIPAIASLLALGAAYGFVRRRSVGVTLALLAAAIPLGIVSNMVRIIVTAAGAHYLGPIAINNVIHTWHGTSVFLMTFATLGLLDAALARASRSRP
jgi:exosortase